MYIEREHNYQCVHMYMCVYICVSICVSLCVCVRQSEKERERLIYHNYFPTILWRREAISYTFFDLFPHQHLI